MSGRFKVVHIRWFGGKGSESEVSTHASLPEAATAALNSRGISFSTAVVNGKKRYSIEDLEKRGLGSAQ